MLFKNPCLSFQSKLAFYISSLSKKTRPLIIKNRNVTTTAINGPVLDHASSKNDTLQFMAISLDLLKNLNDNRRFQDIPDATKWFTEVLQYNVPDVKHNRGLTIVTSYKLLMDKNLTKEGLFLAQVAGWCVEMLQASFAIQDDLEDGSETRQKRPCWYRTHNLGVKAVNDSTFLDTATYQLLRKYIRSKPYYLDVVDLFHDATIKTVMGQCLDLHCITDKNRPKFELFYMDHYSAVVKHKTSYSTFLLPVTVAMFMAGITDTELHWQAKIALLDIGHFFQVENDYFDCFGDPQVTGKVGTDIENGKCTWLAVLALQRANKQQRKIIKDCYGYSNPEKVAIIKSLYEELGVPVAYETYKDERYSIISAQIQQMSQDLLQNVFFALMKEIFHRG